MSELLGLWDSRPSSLYYFNFDVPWIDPVIFNAVLYWKISSLLQKLFH